MADLGQTVKIGLLLFDRAVKLGILFGCASNIGIIVLYAFFESFYLRPEQLIFLYKLIIFGFLSGWRSLVGCSPWGL